MKRKPHLYGIAVPSNPHAFTDLAADVKNYTLATKNSGKQRIYENFCTHPLALRMNISWRFLRIGPIAAVPILWRLGTSTVR